MGRGVIVGSLLIAVSFLAALLLNGSGEDAASVRKPDPGTRAEARQCSEEADLNREPQTESDTAAQCRRQEDPDQEDTD